MFTILSPSIRPAFLKQTQESLERQSNQDFEWLTEVGLKNRGFTLPKDYNKMLRRASGAIVVSLQDAITIPDDFLEYLLTLDFDKKAYTFPVGDDWRKNRSGEIKPEEWELDLAAAPIELFYDIGGFDEEYTDWSFDNVEVGIRAAAAGYKFYCDNSKRAQSIDHDAIEKHPFRDKKTNAHRIPETRTLAKIGNHKLTYIVV